MAHMWTGRLGLPQGEAQAMTPEMWLTTLGVTEAEVRRARRWLMVTGILSLLAGAAAIAVPAVASVATAIFLGWLLIAAGAVMLVNAFSRHDRDRGHFALRLLNAALTLFVGIYLVVAPLHGTLTLTFLLTVWFLAHGVLELWVAYRQRGLPGNGLVALSGLASLVLGVIIAAGLPGSAAWALGLLVGINLIFFGARTLALATVLKRVFG